MTKPFELIHMDLVFVPDYSIYGNKYFLSILDDYSRYSWVLFIKRKSDTFKTFIIWYNQIKNLFDNCNIKYIKTDNGTEFFNNNFNEFYERTGIIHEHTIAHNPQQNGRVERLHGTLISNGDAMLNDAKLNHKFWEDAVSTANYIHNRLPHKGNNNKVPYEILFKSKVDYNKFRVFGCRVYFYVPKQFRKKFCNTTLPGIFLGYDEINHTAYKIYDIKNNKIILARTVEFLEDEPANLSAPLSSPDNINFTNYYEDEEIDYMNSDDNGNNINDENNEYNIIYNINNNNNDNNNNNTKINEINNLINEHNYNNIYRPNNNNFINMDQNQNNLIL